MGFGKQGDAGDTTALAEVVQHDTQHRGTTDSRCLAQRPLDTLGIPQTATLPEIHEQMQTRSEGLGLPDLTLIVYPGVHQERPGSCANSTRFQSVSLVCMRQIKASRM